MADIEKLFVNVSGNMYEPLTWENSTKVCQNYVALIPSCVLSDDGNINLKRKFLKNKIESGSVVFNGSDLPNGAIVEIKNVYKKGSKESITFQGFFSLIHKGNEIHGKRMSIQEIAEYYSAIREFQKIEEPNLESKLKNEINMYLSGFIRKLKVKYDSNLVDSVLTEMVAQIIPEAEENSEEIASNE
jgi:hypothetical protein